ncbi:hypothetical protein DYB37_001147 [Aphanomyces astaci]|uniref:Uncharacterized protein n=2 Tax=Aphanomyces astaci TaxID=112090 RepID=A0A418FME0_APHAT|nr:hypothetical protein DYB37_001147 [Aphanomyces astaci]
MKLIQTTRVVEAMDSAMQAARESTKPSKIKTATVVKCRCKSRRCSDCQQCVKCQCYCNGPPQRPLRPLDGAKKSPVPQSPMSSEGNFTSNTVAIRRRATRNIEPELRTQPAKNSPDDDATTPLSRTPSPQRPDNHPSVSEPETMSTTNGPAKVWAKLTCRCKARRCAECTACSKCSCTCGGNTASPTSAAKRKVVESPAKLPPPSKKSKVAKSTTPRRPSRHGKPVEIDTHESTNETQADVVRRRRSPRGVSVPKSNEDADHNPPAAATDSIPPPHAHDDEITSTTAAAALKMDEETRKMDEELKAWMGKRSDEQEELTQLERQIYELEGAYLRRSQHAGNIVKGYADANVFVAEMAKDELQDPPPNEVVDAQRVFSHSSTTSPAEPPLHVATAAATETAAVAAPPVDVPNHSVVDTHATADRARTLSQELAEADEV